MTDRAWRCSNCGQINSEWAGVCGRCCPEAQPAASVAWDGPANLQIDSYATGRELVLAYINKDRIHLEVTDGSYQWRGSVSVPWNRTVPAVAQPANVPRGEPPDLLLRVWDALDRARAAYIRDTGKPCPIVVDRSVAPKDAALAGLRKLGQL